MSETKSEATQSPEYMKNFEDWFELKPKLDSQNHQPQLVKQGNIW